MTPIEKLEAAITRLETLKAESTSGTWFWESPSTASFPQGDEGLSATSGEWKTCPYYCVFDQSSSTSRGLSKTPGHEHLVSEPVLYGWGYDASGIDGTAADRELIVTLHRTIDAQRSILVRALNLSVARRGQIADAEVKLANAILGDTA